jgi:serine/threonine protein kinase/tetratricopeptide (TPR) repeat protein
MIPSPGVTMTVDPNRVHETFLEAADLSDPADRSAYLDRACGGDAALRRQVEALLAAHAGTGSFLDPASAGGPKDPTDMVSNATAAFDPQPPAPTELEAGAQRPDEAADAADSPARSESGSGQAAGTVIAGRYKLLEVIGEGGMGSVYLAEQTEPVRRQVALKLIKAGMDSKAVLARFDAERQALALMDHPNIARVYDGGTTPAGRPFFVMELVRGVPLTRFCDKGRLSVKARLELFVAVCQAVQHAHQKGIIHRDLKPANVLVTEVDGRPTPKVIDFGVAKATDLKLTEMSFADVGAIVGTPAYMSPEQADPSSMDIDTRTDIYALGVMLYELLAGSPPIDSRQFQRGAVLEMLRMVREIDPPKPSMKVSTADALPSIAATRGVDPAHLKRALAGDLDWIVMKALEKDRTRRYETANGFAADVLRHLADEPVLAAPPSPAYRLRKFVRKNRAAVGAVSLVLLALVVGVIGTTLGLIEARRQKRFAEAEWNRAEAEQTRAETEKTRAEQNFATARALILDMGTQINQIETGQANPKLADLARKQALDKAREQFDQFRSGRPDDMSIQSQAALLHRYAANVSRLLSDYRAAEAAYVAAVRILTDLAARFPEQAHFRDELALTLSDRAMLEKRMGKLKKSAATLDQAWQLAEGPHGSLNVSAVRRTRAMIDLDRATIASALGRFEDAIQFAGEAGDLFGQLKDIPAGERLFVDPLFAAISVNRVAVARRELGQIEKAVKTHEDAVTRMKALMGPKASRDFRFWECEVRRDRARTAAAVPERRAAAVEDLVDVISGEEKLMEEYPNVGFYREAVAAAYLDRGELLILMGQPEPATAALMKSLAVSRELLDKFGVLSASMLVRGQTFLALGRARTAAGKPAEATEQWTKAAKVFELALKIDPDNFHHRHGFAEAERELKPPAK